MEGPEAALARLVRRPRHFYKAVVERERMSGEWGVTWRTASDGDMATNGI